MFVNAQPVIPPSRFPLMRSIVKGVELKRQQTFWGVCEDPAK